MNNININLDKMLINYFDNYSMLSIYQKKSHDRKDLLSSKSSDKCKKGFREILEGN